MAYALEGVATVAQGYIDPRVASNLYPKWPFGALIQALQVGNQKKKGVFGIGRPVSDEILLTNRDMTRAQKQSIASKNFYSFRVHKSTATSSKWMGARDTNPTQTTATTDSPAQGLQNATVFRFARNKTEILIWHHDRDRALQGASRGGEGIAVGQVVEEATEVKMQEHIDQLRTGCMIGAPSNQALDPWDAPIGFLGTHSATNVYGNVNRTVETSLAANVDSTITNPDVKALIDDANLVKNIRINGPGVNYGLTSPVIYQQWKAQVGSAANATHNATVQKMAEMGYTGEVLQTDNVLLMYDPAIRTTGGLTGFDDNEAFFGNTEAWNLIVKSDKNFAVDKFVDISRYAEGAKECDQSFIETELILANMNPATLVRYSVVGT